MLRILSWQTDGEESGEPDAPEQEEGRCGKVKRSLWFIVPMLMVLALTAALAWLVHPEAVEPASQGVSAPVEPVWKTLNDFALIHVVPAFREGSTTEVVGVREIRRLPVQVDLTSGALRLPPELMKGAR